MFFIISARVHGGSGYEIPLFSFGNGGKVLGVVGFEGFFHMDFWDFTSIPKERNETKSSKFSVIFG